MSGVLVACQQPDLLHFHAEKTMPPRLKALFPRQHEQAYADAMAAFQSDMERAKAGARGPRTVRLVFGELARRRESILRFGEVRTILTPDPHHVVDDLFARYVRMETPASLQTLLATP